MEMVPKGDPRKLMGASYRSLTDISYPIFSSMGTYWESLPCTLSRMVSRCFFSRIVWIGGERWMETARLEQNEDFLPSIYLATITESVRQKQFPSY
mmetsp:Transcript_2368/g.5426  ORF Transcript_2368/g.5426 Transcript_2368/m.5426 type:complete len:96 (+) Transcript_2368:934-1221(+)